MTNNLLKAKGILQNEGLTCALVSDNDEVKCTQRGVLPLLNLLDSKKDFSAFSCADKVVGAAAAYLYVLLNVKEVFAFVISDSAVCVLENAGIKCFYNEKVNSIINRDKTGVCPMESAVKNVKSAEEASALIRNKLKILMQGKA